MRAKLLPLLALVLLPALASAADRKVVANKADCTVSVGDRQDNGTDLIRADCTWPIAADKVIAVVKAADKHDDYLASVGESTVLADGRVLQVHKASGISDRQITLTFTESTLPDGGYLTKWTRAKVQEPLRDGMVDVPIDDGSWEVHADGAGSTVVYTLRYDAGGKVPAWLVRSFQSGGIADLVAEMRKAAETR